MVGGFSFARSKFNRATQARRQLGSTFKPIVYTAAIHRGFTPASTFIDEPCRSRGRRSAARRAAQLRPQVRRTHHVPPRARTVSQIPAVKAMSEVGPRQVVQYARAVRPRKQSSALSLSCARAAEATLVDATRVFGVPESGRADGAVFRHDHRGSRRQHPRAEPTAAHQAIRADTAFVMTNLLRGVVQRGTAQRRPRWTGRSPARRERWTTRRMPGSSASTPTSP